MKSKENKKTEKKISQPEISAKPKAVKPKRQFSLEPKFGLHNLMRPKGAHKKRRVLGRGPGSGHGKTSTRGSKGQTSRAGRHFYAGFEGGQSPLIRRIPKRGFTNKFKKEFQIVNLSDLNKIKETAISPELLEQKGIIKDKNKLIKILGDGQIKNPITIQAHAFSKKASQEIKNAGGSIQIINV
jgi:large subunit ribosomal protein L15